jgi:CRP-like cAMP-binding protein
MADPLDLAQLKLPKGSEIPALLHLCRDIEALRMLDGECLVTEGETGQDLFLLLRGSLVVEKAGEGPHAPARPLTTLEAEPDSPVIVGEMAYFGAYARTATVRSVGASQVLRLSPKHVDRVLESFPGLTRLLFRQFTYRLQETSTALREFQSKLDLAAQRRMAQPGEVLFTAGQPSTDLIQIAVGSVRLEGPGPSRVVGPADLPGGFLCVGAWLTQAPWPYTATVEETCFLASIGGDRREAFIAGQPALVLQLLRAR